MIDWAELCRRVRVDGPLAISYTYLGEVRNGNGCVTVRQTRIVPSSDGDATLVLSNDYQLCARTEADAVLELYARAKATYLHELGEWFRVDDARPFYPH